MSELDQLVNACLLPGFQGETVPPWVRAGLADGLAGVVLFPHNHVGDPESLPRLAGELRAVRGDALVAVDEEGGDVTRLHYATGSPYPGNLALGVVDDLGLTERTAASIAAELVAAGINYNLAPSLDVNSDPDNPIIGVRSFGADPKLVAAHGAAAIRAMQDAGIAVAAKHFPGHGATVNDSHSSLPVIDCDLDTFRARELAPFLAAIEAGVCSIMTAHVVFPVLDPQRPASLSRRLQHTLVREELGYDGVLLSTAVAMESGVDPEACARTAVRALASGADLLLLGLMDGERLCADIRVAVAKAVRDGTLDVTALETAAARVAAMRVRADPTRGDRGAPPSVDVAAGRTAAGRATDSRGTVTLPGPATVVELRAPANVIAGDAHWGLVEPLTELGLVARGLRVETPDTTPEQTLVTAAGGPLVLVVRDAYRHPWQRGWVERVLSGRPDAVLVAVGMPDDAALTGGALIRTYGAGRVNLEAAAALLAGRTP